MKKHSFIIYSIIVAVVGLSLIMYASQEKQESRSHASAATILSFSPSSTFDNPIQKRPGDRVSLDIIINPGSNYVSIVKLKIKYDTFIFNSTGDNTLVLNNAALPAIIEGPVIDTNNGVILVTLSVGSDPGKAIKTPTKLATLNLIAEYQTGGVTYPVTFDPATTVYSVAPSDHAFENVLATAIPAFFYISKNAMTIATPTTIPSQPPILTDIPTVTVSPTITQTPTITPASTTIPSSPPPTPDPNKTNFSTTLCLHGIGKSGDNSNPNLNTLSNKNPLHKDRNITLKVYDNDNKLITQTTGAVHYDQNTGCFTGMTGLQGYLAQGGYFVKIKSDGYLQKKTPNLMYISASQVKVTLPELGLVAGDLTGDNIIDILDFNIISSCYSDRQVTASCSADNQSKSDLNDDGQVDQIDYNLFLREIGVQYGE